MVVWSLKKYVFGIALAVLVTGFHNEPYFIQAER